MKEEAGRRFCASLKISKDPDAVHAIEILREDFLDDGVGRAIRADMWQALFDSCSTGAVVSR